jgi:acetyltransferase-like isoleucine patch superfamily enzyme
MTLRSRLLSFFPLMALLADLAALGHLLLRPRPLAVFIVLLAVYGFPLLVFRLVSWMWPIRPERAQRLDQPVYSPWWGAHQVQLIFESFPFLEAALRLVPGLYSLWLRAWGARVGKKVYWPPTVRIMDRSLIDIGDRVVFGHHVECVSHFVTTRKEIPLLFVRAITIESDVFVGTHVALGPGVRIGAGSLIGAFSRLGPSVLVAGQTRVPPGTELVANVQVDASSFAETRAQTSGEKGENAPFSSSALNTPSR